jgi:mRNA interferase MazF
MFPLNVRRGEIWTIDFDPPEGHEQGGNRPSVVISSNSIDLSSTEMAIVIPGTKTARTDPSTGEILPDVLRVEPSAENGLSYITYFLCSQVRAVSTKRFLTSKRMGRLTDKQLYKIEDVLIFLLDLGEKDIS